MVDRAKQERQRQHVHDRHEAADRRHVGAVEVDRADPGLLDGLLFLAELAGMEHPDLVLAAALFGDQAAHVTQRLHRRIILGLGIGGAKFARQRGGRDAKRNSPAHRADRAPRRRQPAKRRRDWTRATTPPYGEFRFPNRQAGQSSRGTVGKAIGGGRRFLHLAGPGQRAGWIWALRGFPVSPPGRRRQIPMGAGRAASRQSRT